MLVAGVRVCWLYEASENAFTNEGVLGREPWLWRGEE